MFPRRKRKLFVLRNFDNLTPSPRYCSLKVGEPLNTNNKKNGIVQRTNLKSVPIVVRISWNWWGFDPIFPYKKLFVWMFSPSKHPCLGWFYTRIYERFRGQGTPMYFEHGPQGPCRGPIQLARLNGVYLGPLVKLEGQG